MDLKSYQLAAQATAVYPAHINGANFGPAYCALGLVGEAGEIANKVKKIYRDNDGKVTVARQTALKKELGDVMWYVAMLCLELNLDPNDVLAENLDKLRSRAVKGTLQGEGDGR